MSDITIVNNITTNQSNSYYIDNTDVTEPFLAFDGDAVEDTIIRFTGSFPTKLSNNFKHVKSNVNYLVSEKGTKLTMTNKLYMDAESSDFYHKHDKVVLSIGSLILYDSNVYVKINMTGSFSDQWKMLNQSA